jgi:uncharacterized protein (TIGR02001 family)
LIQNQELQMKKNNFIIVAVLLAASFSAAAGDNEKTFYGWTPTASITLANDYIWRGVSQTSNGATIQGSFDMAHDSGIYFGAWASNVEFGDTNNSMELDLYAGFSNEISLGGIPFTYDIGFLHYEYPEETGLNFNEVYFGLGVTPFENFNFSTYYYQDIGVESKPGTGYLDIGADYTLPDAFWNIQVLAHAGHYWRRGANDYWDWKVGLAKELYGFGFEVAYVDTSGADAGDLDDSRIYFGITRSFGDDAPSDSLPKGFDASASFALTTDYVWRGISQTNNSGAIQGSFDISHESGAYFGVWGSNVDFGDGGDPINPNNNSIELDIYLGFSRDIDLGGMALTYDIGWLHYQYPLETDSLNFNELYFGLSASPVENLNLSGYWYHDLALENRLGIGYMDLAADYTLPDWAWNTAIVSHVGYYPKHSNGGKEYWDWKVGVAKDIAGFNIEVAYTDTSGADAADNTDDARAVATLSTTF